MKYEVVVVGAGPAGSTVAKFLSEKGLKVLLLDKSKFPRDKPCGGGLTVKVLERFKYIREKDLVGSYSYGGYAYSSSLKHRVELQRNEPVIGMIVRKKFDYDLVKLAVENGTVFRDRKCVKDVKISSGKAKVILDNGNSIESEIVVGADGLGSIIAKRCGLARYRENICVCVFQEYRVDKKILDRFFGEKRLCHLHPKLQGIAGYGWVFPKKEHVNIGICDFSPLVHKLKDRTGKINLKEAYKDYINVLRKSNIVPDDLSVEGLKGGVLPIRPLEKTYADRVLLCGDAAGFINPVSGEGIYYAMSSGEVAAGVIAEALEAGDMSSRFLSRYETVWKKDFGKEIKMFLNASRYWSKESDNLFRLISKDKQIAEICLGILIGQLSIYGYRWKLIRRFLFAYFKDLFGVVGS